MKGIKIELFEHNQTAYEVAVRMMEEEGKAAVIHPTGTGKSFIAFKLAWDYPEAEICWLAPSEYIYNTQKENLISAMPKEADFSNIEFISYSKLIKDKTLIHKICPDYIVLDEFHRCGAAEWGKGVRNLLDCYPKAKVLGLSATNIRYLDGQRDMAQEIFQGNIASKMTLGEAVFRRILPAPKYILAIYSWQKELAKLEQRVEKLRQWKEKAGKPGQERRLLEQLRRALEKADGLDEVFRKHMEKKHGKYIVFCADKNRMDEAEEHAGEWFHLVDQEPHIYTVYYGTPGAGREFAAFKEDKGDHLKLLFCIDMLNEGVHVEDVDGVILLRPTISPTLYLQQIGRALSSGSGVQPIIFDLVNNLEGLCCIDFLEQELEEVLEETGENISWEERIGGGQSRFYGKFRIIDEVGDCRRLFCRLQERLGASWDAYYLAAVEYYRNNGHLRIPKGYMTPAGLSLGSWIQTQRKVYAGKVPGNLTKEKIKKLEAIGMEWSLKGSSWERGYLELAAYYEKYGNVDVKARYVSENGFALGKWVSNLRGTVKKKGIDQVLDSRQQKQLEALEMVWDKNGEKWETYLEAAREYKEKYGDLRVPAGYVTEEGIALGSWLHCLKHGKTGRKGRAETLARERKAQLDALGMEWGKTGARLWDEKFRLAEAYYEQNGNLDIPVSYCVDGINLGRWIANIRSKRKNPESSGMMLDENRVRQLDSIGMNWK